MGLVYDAADSDKLKTALAGNLTTALSVLEATDSAARRLAGALRGGELSGRGYSAAELVLSRDIAPQIAAARDEVAVIEKDLARFTHEDSKVNRFGVLKEDELTRQLAATRAQRDLTERLKEMNEAVAAAADGALPGVGEALRAVGPQLELTSSQGIGITKLS